MGAVYHTFQSHVPIAIIVRHSKVGTKVATPTQMDVSHIHMCVTHMVSRNLLGTCILYIAHAVAKH